MYSLFSTTSSWISFSNGTDDFSARLKPLGLPDYYAVKIVELSIFGKS